MTERKAVRAAISDENWERARSLRNHLVWQSNASVEPLARALQDAERRGEEAMLDAHEARVFMHHAAEERCDELHAALSELIHTVDTAYPGNAWTAFPKEALHRPATGEGQNE